jgi:hypothetical protein
MVNSDAIEGDVQKMRKQVKQFSNARPYRQGGEASVEDPKPAKFFDFSAFFSLQQRSEWF